MMAEVEPLRSFLRAFFLLALALQASAQSLARFVPAEARASATAPLELRFVRESARGIELQPWPVREVGWLFVRGEGTQQNHDALAPRAEDATRLVLELETTGPALVGWDLPPRIERMQPAALRAFLAERSPDHTAPRALQALAAGETVPVLRLESLQLLAGSPAPAGPSAVALGKSGLRMELRALFDPGSAAPGSDLPFRIYLPEGGRQDVLARCVHLESRAALPAALAQDNTVRARPDRPGAWLLEASRVRALDGSPAVQGATLELASTTFVFVVPAAAGEKREGGR
jgi:hypothetical protein